MHEASELLSLPHRRFGAMFRAAVAGLLIPAAAVECEQVQLGDRVDCTRMDEDSCRAAGCCWGPVSPNPGNAPWCFFSNRTLQSCTLGGDAKARYPMRAFVWDIGFSQRCLDSLIKPRICRFHVVS